LRRLGHGAQVGVEEMVERGSGVLIVSAGHGVGDLCQCSLFFPVE
jgi:hypothetical protein